MALRKYLKIEPENKRKSGEDSSSLSRKDVEMAGREVRRVATGRIRNSCTTEICASRLSKQVQLLFARREGLNRLVCCREWRYEGRKTLLSHAWPNC